EVGRVRSGEDTHLRRCCARLVRARADTERLAVREAKEVGRGGMDRAGDVECRTWAEQDTGWVEEKEISAGIARGIDRSVDVGDVPPSAPADDIARIPLRCVAEHGRIVLADTEVPEAME